MDFRYRANTTLVTEAIYAETTHRLRSTFISVGCLIGAIAGDNIGYGLGAVSDIDCC